MFGKASAVPVRLSLDPLELDARGGVVAQDVAQVPELLDDVLGTRHAPKLP